jgi:hypothetical protein
MVSSGARLTLFLLPALIALRPAPAFPQAPLIAPEVVTRDADGHAILRATRISAGIQIDGRLDEAVYRDIRPAGGFIQQEPHEGSAATDDTEVWVFFDDKNIYVAARMHETDPSKRVTSDMRRDSNNLYNNDHIAVLFDTFDDGRNGFGFMSNAQGGIFDWQVTNEQPSNNWNGLFDVHTADIDGGWAAEFLIPFRSMRFKEGSTEWGINFRRMVRWKNELTFLSAIPSSWGRRGISKVSSAAKLVGLTAPDHLRNLDVKPYALASSATNNRAAPDLRHKNDLEFGVDAKWGITQSIVTDLTYNTDFAQVEDDEAQVNLTRFSVLFPEKRDFFLEGQDIFSFAGAGARGGGGQGPTAVPGGGDGGGNNVTPIVFFSRRIGLQSNEVVPILGGGRLIGRGNGFQIGAIHMHTDDVERASIRQSDFSVLRINKDVLKRSRIGMVATRRSPGLGAGDNLAYGVDTTINPLEELAINGYWSATGGTSRESSYRGQVNWNADRTGLQLEHLYVGDAFNPEIGFLRRSAFRRSYGQARFSPRPARWKSVRKLYYEASYDYFEDAGGRPESREAQGASRMELANGDQLAVEYSRVFEGLALPFLVTTGVTVPAGRYEFQQTKLLYTSSPQRPLSGTLTLNYGGFYSGTLKELTWRGRVEFGPRFYAEPTISLNYFKTPFGDGDANIISSRLTYTLTPRMFASALVQYQSSSASMSTNARFRWEYQPGSELFVVYSDGRTTAGPGFPSIDNRSFVVKLTKLFRF